VSRHARRAAAGRQRGISLFIVLVMVLLVTLLVLHGSRTALFNEMITGTDSDYQRALEAAQAMVRDAELDLMGRRPDGSPCGSGPDSAFGNCRPSDGLRSNIDIANKKVYFPPPGDGGEFDYLQSQLASKTPSCVAGACIAPAGGTSPTATAFWQDTTTFETMKGVAATYGQYTGAKAEDAAAGATEDGDEIDNPLLATGTPRAWYWIEPLRYQTSDSNASRELAPVGGDVSASASGIVYRITAVAQGLKPGTLAVIQTVFVRRQVSG